MILIRVVVPDTIELEVDWIDVGTLGPLDMTDSCNMALEIEPNVR